MTANSKNRKGMNRIQFQPGLSLTEFLAAYDQRKSPRDGTEAACSRALRRARWPSDFVCADCGHAHASRLRFGQTYWQCSACHAQTRLRGGTLFASSKLPLTTWFLALSLRDFRWSYLLTHSKNGLSALSLKRHLGVCYRTAWRIKHDQRKSPRDKLMQAMADREIGRQLEGFVQIDDAYLGGKLPGGKPGRGSENKRPFLIAVETDAEGYPGHAVIEPVPTFDKKAIEAWGQTHLVPGAEVYSDGLGAFRAVVDLDHAHTVIVASTRKAACEDEGARWVNIVLGNLKRSLDGTHHAFHFFKYADRYLGEAAWRFNRRFHLKALIPRLLVAAARCKPRSEHAPRAVPVFSPC
ncbi:MAG: IS1595 family transposase [Metallibacterium sp.]